MFFNKNSKKISFNNLPKSIGIIMDGNGRWAKKRGLPRSVGHRAGAETLRKIVEYCDEIGIKSVTAYAFSTENWKRPKAEVDNLMKLLEEYLTSAEEMLFGKNAVIKVIGNIDVLSESIKQKIKDTEQLTKNNTGVVLNLAINYGGRDELVSAINKCIKDGITTVTQSDIEKRLYSSDLTDVDLIIRPSGEYRLSNFLLWQSAYAEFWFDDVLWPDFTIKHLNKALADYQSRNRRFGGV